MTGLFVCTLSVYGQQAANDVKTRVNTIFKQLTLDQKLSYIGGTGFFDIKPVPEVANFPGVLNPQIYQTDGPLGVRRNSPSVRFPSGLVLAATWNPTLAYEQGVGMGQDTRARGYFAIEGPGMDFYRVPLNGRNFEYMTGEDPYLGSQLAPSEIKGIQSQGVWACAKHLVCNDEEENRTNVHIVVDERTLREIYLPPFEASVKVGHAATVMGAYNAIKVLGLGNAVIEDDFCSENGFLLKKVLKGDWGFKGILVSDYLAIHNGVLAALNGCDVDLPDGRFMNATTLGPVIGAGLLPVSLPEGQAHAPEERQHRERLPRNRVPKLLRPDLDELAGDLNVAGVEHGIGQHHEQPDVERHQRSDGMLGLGILAAGGSDRRGDLGIDHRDAGIEQADDPA